MLRLFPPKMSASHDASNPRLYRFKVVDEPPLDNGGSFAWAYSAEPLAVGMALAFSRLSAARDCCSLALATFRLGLAVSARCTSSLSSGSDKPSHQLLSCEAWACTASPPRTKWPFCVACGATSGGPAYSGPSVQADSSAAAAIGINRGMKIEVGSMVFISES